MIPHLWAIALGAAVVAGGTAAGVVLVTSGPLAPGSADQAASVTPAAGTPSATPKVTPTPSSSDTSDTGQTPRPATPTRTASATGTVSATASGTATATGTPTAIVRIPPDTIITGTTNFDFNALPVVDTSGWKQAVSPNAPTVGFVPSGWTRSSAVFKLASWALDGRPVDYALTPGDAFVDASVMKVVPSLPPSAGIPLPISVAARNGSPPVSISAYRVPGSLAGIMLMRVERLPDGRFLVVIGTIALPARAVDVAVLLQAAAMVHVP